ncbi:DUF6559 family protein [Kangiella shandongensis]|uniref:DUF6559 family protein n=1 Tax=Kangiella shandongensis TaxID=2763258 RepID=UPI001CBC960C|nr:DUF6559 family protein [Kangiella shandongensis]
MNLITKFRIKRAIRRFILRLPTLLTKDYGKRKHYTPKQIKATLDRHSLRSTHVLYAYAIFAHHDSFYQHLTDSELDTSVNNYDMMREKVAEQYFNGDTTFDASSLDTSINTTSDLSDVAGGENIDVGSGNSDS